MEQAGLSKESKTIRGMFGRIAPRYDFINHALSLNIDHLWRRSTLKALKPYLSNGGPVLDLCTGTGDLALGLAQVSPVIGCDFTHAMLVIAAEKARRKRTPESIRFTEGDALNLPFADDCFSALTVAFGLRNLENYRQGIEEMFRVIRPGGALAILEFSHPRLPVFKQAFGLYSRYLLPRVGRWISGDRSAYDYLPASVEDFLSPEEVSRLIAGCGFRQVRCRSLTGGVAALHVAEKKADQDKPGRPSKQGRP